MPLPPLLLERLKRKKALSELVAGPLGQEPTTPASPTKTAKKKRNEGIEYSYQDTSGPSVVAASGNCGGEHEEELEEEIIAEDYSDESGEAAEGGQVHRRTKNEGDFEQHEASRINDDCDKSVLDKSEESNKEPAEKKSENRLIEFTTSKTESILGCPNKYNIYHDCSQYCEDNYGQPEALEPTLEQRKQLAIILKTYPMSNEWTVVYDPGVRTFYFWNIITNLVSWFPPAMEGFVSMSADQIRKSMKEMENTSLSDVLLQRTL